MNELAMDKKWWLGLGVGFIGWVVLPDGDWVRVIPGGLLLLWSGVLIGGRP